MPRQGDPALVHIPELAERVSNGEFHGHVTRLSGALDPVTRTMRAEIELPNDGEVLKPGMYGKAKVTLESRFNVLTIPASALVRKAEGKLGVYVVDNPHDVPPRGELKFVEVERGIDNGEMVEVRKGLKGDEMVVAKGNGVLRHGEVVRPVTRQED